jgi:hypothetical protein
LTENGFVIKELAMKFFLKCTCACLLFLGVGIFFEVSAEEQEAPPPTATINVEVKPGNLDTGFVIAEFTGIPDTADYGHYAVWGEDSSGATRGIESNPFPYKSSIANQTLVVPFDLPAWANHVGADVSVTEAWGLGNPAFPVMGRGEGEVAFNLGSGWSITHGSIKTKWTFNEGGAPISRSGDAVITIDWEVRDGAYGIYIRPVSLVPALDDRLRLPQKFYEGNDLYGIEYEVPFDGKGEGGVISIRLDDSTVLQGFEGIAFFAYTLPRPEEGDETIQLPGGVVAMPMVPEF